MNGEEEVSPFLILLICTLNIIIRHCYFISLGSYTKLWLFKCIKHSSSSFASIMKSQTIVSLLFLLTILVVASTQKVPNAPLPACGFGHAKYKDKLFIYGGSVDHSVGGETGQFFYLDLSKPWRSDSPAWVKLPDGPRGRSQVALSSDGKILTAFAYSPEREVHRFHFEHNVWVTSLAIQRNSSADLIPVTLGAENTALIAGGIAKESSTEVVPADVYDIYSFDTHSMVTQSLPPRSNTFPEYLFLPGRRDFGAVWSEHYKSAFFFGGGIYINGTIVPSDHLSARLLSIYNAETKQWTDKLTSGYGFGTIVGPCMAITDDGKTIISFGGMYHYHLGSRARDSVSLLDVETGIWKNNTNSRGKGEYYHGCTVSGDYFLVWGGCDSKGMIYHENQTSIPMSIYQISKDAWVEEYQPPTSSLKPDLPTSPISSITSTPSSTPTGSSHHSASGLNIGVIVGGAAGAVVVVVAILLLVWRRRKIVPKNAVKNNGSTVEGDHHISSPDDKHNGYKHDTGVIRRMSPDNSTLRSPQVTYRHEYDGDLYGGKRVSPKAAAAPHYPSWGANFNESYATDGSLYGYNQAIDPNNANPTRLQPTPKRYPSPPTSPYNHVVPPPPHYTSPPIVPPLHRPRDPQMIEQGQMMRRTQKHSRNLNGRGMEEQRQPQWPR